MMLALEMFRSLPRTVAGKTLGDRLPLVGGMAHPIRLVTIDPPRVDKPGWARLRTRLSGICGSDLGAVSGKTSLYFSAVVSFPFVPGHEVVADLMEDCEDLPKGTRVVIDPVLTCAARGVEPCAGLRRRGDQPLQPDHRRPPRSGPADRLLHHHGRRLGPAAQRPPQPDVPRAGGLLRRAGRAGRADRLRGPLRAAGRRAARTPGCWSAAPARSAC